MNTEKTTREITVCRFGSIHREDDATYFYFPEIRMRGKWLLDAGFRSGQVVSITSVDGKLIIEPVREPQPLSIAQKKKCVLCSDCAKKQRQRAMA